MFTRHALPKKSCFPFTTLIQHKVVSMDIRNISILTAFCKYSRYW